VRTVRAAACRAANAMAAVSVDPPPVAPSPAEVAAVGVGDELPEGYDQMMPTVEPSRRRRAGVLLHPTSLRGPHGIGDLGDEALAFLHWLRDAGCTLWQVRRLVPRTLLPRFTDCLILLASHAAIRALLSELFFEVSY